MAKRNNVLSRIEQKAVARYELLFNQRVQMLLQIACDSACMACNDVFQMGPSRSIKFVTKMKEYTNQLCAMLLDDVKDDKDFEYTKQMVDDRLKTICGEHFEDWDSRYG